VCKVKPEYVRLKTLFRTPESVFATIRQMKNNPSNFSLSRQEFQKLLHLDVDEAPEGELWFSGFSRKNAAVLIDGLEFLAVCIVLNRFIDARDKIRCLFHLFDLNVTGYIIDDEFTIFLRAVTAGLHRVVHGFPFPPSFKVLDTVAGDYFDSLERKREAREKSSDGDAAIGHHVSGKHRSLDAQMFFTYLTETPIPLHLISMFSSLGAVVLAWGSNSAKQLGVHYANSSPSAQLTPTPLLQLEGRRAIKVATSQHHTLILTAEGHVYTMGTNICGVLGMQLSEGESAISTPTKIDTFCTKVVDIACGARHSVAVGERGRVFTWGSAKYGQLGHGDLIPEAEASKMGHESQKAFPVQWRVDVNAGPTCPILPKPTTVQSLYSNNIYASSVACGAFTTYVITTETEDAPKRKVFAWGNDSEQQCAQGIDPAFFSATKYVRSLSSLSVDNLNADRDRDSFLQQAKKESRRTGTIVCVDPLLPVNTRLLCQFSPVEIDFGCPVTKIAAGGSLAVAIDAEGRVWSWGARKPPHLVEKLIPFVCAGVDVGDTQQCIALCSLYKCGIRAKKKSASSERNFTLHGLPIDRLRGKTDVEKAPLLQIGLPFSSSMDVDGSTIKLDLTAYPPEKVKNSVILADRAPVSGDWLKLSSTDYDFPISMTPDSDWQGISGEIILLNSSNFSEDDCEDKICIFEILGTSNIVDHIWDLAERVTRARGRCCLVMLPQEAIAIKEFSYLPPEEDMIPTGIFRGEDDLSASRAGPILRNHLRALVKLHLHQNPEELDGWMVIETPHAGTTYLHEPTGKRRSAPPIIWTGVTGKLIGINEDDSVSRLKKLVELEPKGIIYCQPSCNPECELMDVDELPDIVVDNKVPIMLVPYDAGEELKCMICDDSVEVSVSLGQEVGAVFSWDAEAIDEEEPKYEKALHDCQVRSVACGKQRLAASTLSGDVFTWDQTDTTPYLVEQIEGLAKATKVFAGADQTFVLADLPFQSILC